ncbi:hypothetical protein [uncultured Hoeflea sp.]|uniref:hypothetical protein n=1 Tax=uncultured Hoeflea sp. TaxID=538666 RepID=UPI00262CCC65|nr:hypothetical protein [uncultured Hoeflea sp.]
MSADDGNDIIVFWGCVSNDSIPGQGDDITITNAAVTDAIQSSAKSNTSASAIPVRCRLPISSPTQATIPAIPGSIPSRSAG